MSDPMGDRPKTAWVIGSGFSKALGGPLLDGLLSASALEDTQEVFPDLTERDVVYSVFKSRKGERWEHAEQFLEFVDLAVDTESPKFKILRRLISGAGFPPQDMPPARFRDLATLSIAAEVSTYTENLDLRTEAWAPYTRWASGRRGNDSVITFNYDTVIECLGRSKEPHVRHLGEDTAFLPIGSNRFEEDECIIYKVHGSANWGWAEKEREKFKVFGSIAGFNLVDGYRPLIAMPGATKKQLCGEHLENIWTTAMQKLREAEVIVFLGYRFPPSDSFARTTLFAAIQQNTNPYLRIHTVLGPNIAQEASARLEALLRAFLEGAGRKKSESDTHRQYGSDGKTYSLMQQPLYVEDFLSVLSMDMLYGKRSGTGPIEWE